MAEIIRIGMDTSKSVFQLHGVNAREEPVLRKKPRRREVEPFFAKLEATSIGMEACGAAHYWAPTPRRLGHRVVLVPPQYATAGKQHLGGITRAGDEAVRRVLIVGAMAHIQQIKRGRTKPSPWLAALSRRKPAKLAAVALANKMARIAWKLMVSGERYRANPAAAAA